jgi:hypothetical protein
MSLAWAVPLCACHRLAAPTVAATSTAARRSSSRRLTCPLPVARVADPCPTGISPWQVPICLSFLGCEGRAGGPAPVVQGHRGWNLP